MIALRDQPYSDERIPDRVFDFFRPDTTDLLPLVVFCHGGGWISGDKTMYREEALWLAQQGYAAACVGYRLAPLHVFPAAVADIQAFIAHARTHADELDVDPTAIIVMGNSAGGHLANMSALCKRGLETLEPSERPNAVVSLCGLTDLRNYKDIHFPIAFSFIEQFMGGTSQGREKLFEQASPTAHVTADAPLTIIIHGVEDEIVPVEQARSLYSALCACGVPAELHELPGENHVLSYAGWQTVRERLLELLDTI